MDEKFTEEAFIDVGLNWSREVVTACDFEQFPEWEMLSMTIEGMDGPPSATLLSQIAKAFGQELKAKGDTDRHRPRRRARAP